MLTFVLKKMPQNFEDFRPTHSSDMDISDQSTPDRNVVEKVGREDHIETNIVEKVGGEDHIERNIAEKVGREDHIERNVVEKVGREVHIERNIVEKVGREDHIESRRSGRPHKPNTLPDFVQGKEATTHQVYKRERAKPTTLPLQRGKRGRGRPRKDAVTHCESLDRQQSREKTRNNKKTAGLVFKWRSLETEKRSIVSPPTTVTPLSDPCGKSVMKPNALSFSLSPNSQSPSFWNPGFSLHNLPSYWNPSTSLHNLPGSVAPCNLDSPSIVSRMNSSATREKLNHAEKLTSETVSTMQNATEVCDHIVSKVCNDILEEDDDDVCIIDDPLRKKSVEFQDEKLNCLYNRIESRYGCLQGCQKVNQTVHMNLTLVLQVVSDMEMVDITSLKEETLSNWESAISVGKHLNFKVSWLEDKLNELKLLAKRTALKEAIDNASELVAKLEKDFEVAKENFELAKKKMEALDQEKRDATKLLDNATASYQKPITFQLDI